nr:HNH/ENDO VII family nuclease [Rummeliibacillus sp. SL167]
MGTKGLGTVTKTGMTTVKATTKVGVHKVKGAAQKIPTLDLYPYAPQHQSAGVNAGIVPYNTVNSVGLRDQLISMAKVEARGSGTGTKGTDKIDKTYSRPSGYRKGVRDEAWEKAKGADSEVRDPGTGKVMKKEEPWDMGHKPGYEFRKHQRSAQERGISRKEFLDEHNNPDHYRPELPSSNRSHKGEDLTDNYFGD